MERIKYYLEKYRIQCLIILSIIILLIIIAIPNNEKDEHTNTSIAFVEKEEPNDKVVPDNPIIKKIKVDVKGAVVNPGVYELNEGARVQDAINEAGGLDSNSNVEYINLSKKLKDEMVIIIYTNEYIEKYKNDEEKIIYIKYECDCPDAINDACIKENDVLNDTKDSNGIAKDETEESKIVSINTGTIEELMTLPGIGESKAKAIIEYREKNGEFKSLEDIMNVSGIGEAAYSKIKDNIKL